MSECQLSEHQLTEFQEQGFLKLGYVAADEQLHALQTRIDDLMMGCMPNDGIWFQLDTQDGQYGSVTHWDGQWKGPTLNYRKIENLERDPLFLAYMRHPLFRDLTRKIIGPNISVYRAMFMNKPAERGTVLPYHQDGGTGWGLSIAPIVTVWTALDDTTRDNGCVQVIPGSHKLGLLSEQGHTITPEQEAQYAREEDSVYLEGRAGEVFLLHNWLLHRSGTNPTPNARRAFSVCYMDAATRSVNDSSRTFLSVFSGL
jgi:phytanoyl-CoA hydroxylase